MALKKKLRKAKAKSSKPAKGHKPAKGTKSAKSTKSAKVHKKARRAAPKPKTMALVAEPTVDDVLHQWLSQSTPGQPIPNVDQLQVAWASFGSGGAFTVQVQQKLADLLNNAFALDPPLVPANLPGTLTVGQLKLNLHRSS